MSLNCDSNAHLSASTMERTACGAAGGFCVTLGKILAHVGFPATDRLLLEAGVSVLYFLFGAFMGSRRTREAAIPDARRSQRRAPVRPDDRPRVGAGR